MQISRSNRLRLTQLIKASCALVVLGLSLVGNTFADDKPKLSIGEQYIQDLKDGRIGAAGDDDHVVKELIIKRNIPITYKYISTLMSTPNAFGTGVACTTCHNSQDASKSYRGMDLTTYEGIMLGADSIAKGVDKATKVIIPGNSSLSFVWQHLSKDRMPPGNSPSEPRDHPNTTILSAWIKQVAKCD